MGYWFTLHQTWRADWFNLIGGFRWENHEIKCMIAQQTMFDYRRVYA